MGALHRKAIADLRSHRLQVILLFIILTAAAAKLTLSVTVQRSADRPWERLFKKTNGAHVLFFNDRIKGASPLDLNQIKTLDGVTGSSGPLPVVWDQAVVKDGKKNRLNVFGIDPNSPATVGAPLVTDGSWLRSGASREIVLDRSFAKAVGLTVGDTVEFRGTNGLVSLTVAGLAVNPLTSPYPNSSPGTAYAAQETLALLEPDQSHWGSVLAVRLANPDATSQFIFRVHQLWPSAGIATTTWQDTREELTLVNKVNSLILGIVSLFALVAVGLIIANTIGGRVLSQFRDIGLLKAIGFTPRQVTWLFLVQHLLIALAASLIGLAIGLALAPYFLRQTADAFHTSAAPVYDPLLAAAIVLGILGVVAMFTLLPSWRGGHISTVQAITTGFAPVHARPSRLASVSVRLHLPTTVVLGLKDAFARPLRSWMSVIALILTVVTVTTALGVEATIQRLIDNPGLDGDAFDMSIVGNGVPAEDIQRLLAAKPEVASYSTQTWVWTTSQSSGFAGQGLPPLQFGMRALGGDYQHSGYILTEGRMVSAPGEAVAGRALLDILGLKIGDELRVQVSQEPGPSADRKPLSLRIVGRYLESDNGGMMAMFPLESLLAVEPEITPTSYAVQLAPNADGETLKTELLDATNYRIDATINSTADTAADTRTIRSVLLGLSLVLVSIGVANLFSTTLLGVRERSRDFGIFKTIGMSPGQIIISVVAGVALLSLIATILGIPLGLIVNRLMFDQVGRNVAGLEPEVYAPPAWWWLALILPGAILATVISGVIPARQASKIQVAEVLRNE